ncbi:hypothetical protein CN378_05085 [Bacillus sp. AFS015802]|uniref:DUF3993 domain-containing protein n=1 Tax=Bacillus sp. AFS015802 TaxID=2033486 RepID=UPI000BF865A0|nr:DUF3993 domain-containing protein [Bacillus sp. AFS015802]PFA68857.1 hypothetical protein CN378_05085 [Bacillus sp. AFS015802]
MEKKKLWLLFFILGLVTAACGQVSQTQASEFKKENALNLVEDAFRTQVSLSEEPQSKKQIEEKLSKYLTEGLTTSFMSENLYEVDGGYITFGSDFASHYVPFFDYDESTRVKYIDGHWYVWEERKNQEDGPFSSTNGIEAVVLSEEEGTWKVSSITYDLPEDIQSR